MPKKVWDTLPPLPPEEPQPESPTSEGESEEVDVNLTEQGEQMLSPFEQQRLDNIAENERMLQQLGLVSGHGSLNVPDGRGRGRGHQGSRQRCGPAGLPVGVPGPAARRRRNC